MLLGSIMCAIMTVSSAAFIDNAAIKIILLIFTLFIFYSLVFTAAYKDGVYEQKLVSNKRIEEPKNNRWIAVGFVMFLVMCVPSVILIAAGGLQSSAEFMYFYNFFNGSVYPLLLMMISTETAQVDIVVPLVVMGTYLLVPLMTYVGYDFGYKNKFNGDFMYKK